MSNLNFNYINFIIIRNMLLEKAKEWIKKAINHLELEFSKLQAWRANPAIVEDIKVESYWTMQPIKNIASINVLDSQTLSIAPWDRSQLHAIAKAITESGIWLNPIVWWDNVMIKIPQLTEERRKELVKIAKKIAEEAKISIRNARQESLKDIKQAKDKKEITEDDEKEEQNNLQKIIDDANKKIEELTKKKEDDLMNI